MDLNSVHIIGRLTKDCEFGYVTNGSAVAKLSIACNRMKAKDGTTPVDYFNVELWGKQAEGLKSYLVKGKQVAIDGRLKQDRWTGKDGTNQSRVSIIASNVQLIGGVKADNQGQQQSQNQGQQYQQEFQDEGFPEDIPF